MNDKTERRMQTGQSGFTLIPLTPHQTKVVAVAILFMTALLFFTLGAMLVRHHG